MSRSRVFRVRFRTLLALAGVLGVVATTAGIASADSGPSLVSAALLAPSGQAMPRGDLPGWKQIYSQDFGTDVPLGSFPGSVYGSTFGAYPDGWPDTAKQQGEGGGTYMPSKTLSVSNGLLNVNVHTENGVHMVSAPTPTLPGGKGQTYGRYSVRFRADAVAGYKVAWLLWPDSEQWPTGGEIDFPEGDLNGTIAAYAHYANPAGGQDVFEPGTARLTDWHTATIEWIPGKVTFYLDGQVFGVSTRDVPSQPMHWVLQTETCIGGCQPSDTASGNVQIDWVSVWSYSPGTAGSVNPPATLAPSAPPIPVPTNTPPGWVVYAPPAGLGGGTTSTPTPTPVTSPVPKPTGTTPGWVLYAPPVGGVPAAPTPTPSPSGWLLYAPPAP